MMRPSDTVQSPSRSETSKKPLIFRQIHLHIILVQVSEDVHTFAAGTWEGIATAVLDGGKHSYSVFFLSLPEQLDSSEFQLRQWVPPLDHDVKDNDDDESLQLPPLLLTPPRIKGLSPSPSSSPKLPFFSLHCVALASAEKHSGNRMLGWRELVNGKWGPYLWKSYKEVYEETLHAGSALRAHGSEPGARVGIYSSNCPQWIVAMEACNAHSLICVPLYDTLVIVCFTSLTEEQQGKAASMGIKTCSWTEFLNMMTVDDVYISFLPLAHILDRMIEEYFFHKGASVGYYHGQTLLDESRVQTERCITFGRSTCFREGDIGEMLPNGVVKIIDRKKNLIKLSQGEYVALEYLEKVYGITPIVEDVEIDALYQTLRAAKP
ncbi:UNVERIFIED_CONTAM: Long chain acyl-CoA synthetase 1 [Sesamum radiatum]|uniref:Long chain acyl-CoA synthetase 1 n=1 Tax=Sesamum radiatum TaxID=300843 RepID=A0AAW2W3N9_SESRA